MEELHETDIQAHPGNVINISLEGNDCQLLTSHLYKMQTGNPTTYRADWPLIIAK